MSSLRFGETPPPRGAMTPQEAEQVMELWARTHQTDSFAMPSVRELSEALNAPPAEVASLLDQVRRQQPLQQKPKRSVLAVRRTAMVAGILMLMLFGASLGYMAGEENARSWTAATIIEHSPSPVVPPTGYQVSFDGFVIPGSARVPRNARDLMERLEASLFSAIDQMAPESHVFTQPALSSEQFLADLSAGKAIPGVLDFRKATVKGPEGRAELTLPVLLTFHPEWGPQVKTEQTRRIKQLVSKVVAE